MNLGGVEQTHYFIFVLIFMSLAPFIAVMVTSFVKIIVVLSILRNALGIQMIPPNVVLNGLAILISAFIMYPIGQEMAAGFSTNPLAMKDLKGLTTTLSAVKEPLKGFLHKHSTWRERAFFLKSARDIWPKAASAGLEEGDLMVLVPAFMVSELTEAFKMGFYIYLPFIIIDLVVSNILLAMGMMMVSPATIALPVKLLLFVMVDGWSRLIHGLVLTYS